MMFRKPMDLIARLDWLFILSVLALTVIGIVFIYSASYRNEEGWMTALTRRQIVWTLVGIGCFIVALRADYRLPGTCATKRPCWRCWP